MDRETNGVYPSQYKAELLLEDGSRIMLRPIEMGDTDRWLSFVSNLSIHTKYLRFHHVPKQMGIDDAIRFCTVDYKDTFALVAKVRGEQRRDIVDIGRYYRLPSRNYAEIAIVVMDAYQEKGIGTQIIERLANVARNNGITTFEAYVLAENDKTMDFLRDYGFRVTAELEEAVYHVTLLIA